MMLKRSLSKSLNESFSQDDYLDDNSPLFKFCFNNQIQNLEEYFAKNPDVDVRTVNDSKRNTLLHLACMNSQYKICTIIIDKAKAKLGPGEKLAKWINTKNSDGMIPLHYAALRGNFEIIQLLEINGADCHQYSKLGIGVIHLAAEGDQPAAISYYLDKGIDINLKDEEGKTPLHYAANNGLENTCNFLLSWGADPNAQDSESNSTPLHFAVMAGNPKVVKRLIIKGGNLYQRNKDGQSPYEMAKEYNLVNILNILDKRSCLMEFFNIRPKLQEKKSLRTAIWFLVLFLFFVASILVLGIYELIPHSRLALLILSGLILVFFFLTACRNPGTLSVSTSTKRTAILRSKEPSLICPECLIVKLPRSKHCDVCNRCISVYDHHCPWLNNCVGAKNHRFFLIFIITVYLNLILIITLDAWAFVSGAINNENEDFELDHEYVPYVALANLLIALVFFLPLTVLLYVQITNFITGRTTHERYRYNPKKDKVKQQHLLEGSDIVLSEDDIMEKSCMGNCLDMCYNNSKNPSLSLSLVN